MMCRGIAGLQLKAAFELLFSGWKVPIVVCQVVCEGSVSFCQGIVYFECPHSCLSRFRKSLSGRHRGNSKRPQHEVRIRQTRIGQSVTGIAIYCLLEVVNGLPYIFIRTFVPTVTSSEISVVGLDIICVPLRQLLSLFGR